MAELYPGNRALRLRLIGGAREARPTESLSNRDAVGARALVTFGSGRTVLLHKQAGEGFSSQNSEVLSIGCPAGDSVARIDVTWPSGRKTSLATPSLAEIVTIEEV